MKQVEKYIYRDGKKGRLTSRIPVPAELQSLFGKRELPKALGTADLDEGRRLHAIRYGEVLKAFEEARQELAAQRAELVARASASLTHISSEQADALGKHYVHQTLLADDIARSRGLDDDEFGALGDQLKTQREALKGILARGRVERIVPALRGFLHLMGTGAALSEEDERRVALAFARSIADSLDQRIARHEGQSVTAAAPDQPIEDLKVSLQAGEAAVPATSTDGDASFHCLYENWRTHVNDRGKPTCTAMKTAWRDFERVARKHGAKTPAAVTPKIAREFVEEMKDRGLVADTANDRLSKVKHVYNLAVGALLVTANPAEKTIGMGKSALDKRRKKRLPWSHDDLLKVYASPVYDGQHLRSQGNAGEATYWIPLVMYYSGMRPEEVAGLAASDIVDDGTGGHYFDVIDRPDKEDFELYEGLQDDEGTSPDWVVPGQLASRTLKNGASVRRVPVAQQLIDLGLLRYRAWVVAKGERALFPTLTPDNQGKLSGAFGKFFGRYKVELGFQDTRKTLYSFRHCMKDFLERARVPSKVLKRTLGHASGDGSITDGYGSDLPYDVVKEHFLRVQFTEIPVQPWAPGRGYMPFPKLAAARAHAVAAKPSRRGDSR